MAELDAQRFGVMDRADAVGEECRREHGLWTAEQSCPDCGATR